MQAWWPRHLRRWAQKRPWQAWFWLPTFRVDGSGIRRSPVEVNGSWNPHYLQGFKNIQTVVVNGISEASTVGNLWPIGGWLKWDQKVSRFRFSWKFCCEAPLLMAQHGWHSIGWHGLGQENVPGTETLILSTVKVDGYRQSQKVVNKGPLWYMGVAIAIYFPGAITSLKLTFSHLKIGQKPKGKDCKFQASHFQGWWRLLVSGRVFIKSFSA